ncbi:MAG: hypothetical protein ACLFWB_13435 [Armatimonadota bacterium]
MTHEASPEPAYRVRYRHLLAVAAAFIGAIATGLLLFVVSYIDTTGGTADIGVLVAASLPGAAAGAGWWIILARNIARYVGPDPLQTAIAHMALMAPGTIVGGMVGFAGVGFFFGLMIIAGRRSVDLWSSPASGIAYLGALAGATAALVAHTAFAWAMIRAHQRLPGPPARKNETEHIEELDV